MLHDRHIKDLVQRLFKELIQDRFFEVIFNPCLRSKEVISGFKQKLRELADEGNLDLITKPQNVNLYEFQEVNTQFHCFTRLMFVCSEVEPPPI